MQGQAVNLSGLDLERIEQVLGYAWADSTQETYGTGLLVFHVFCDIKNIPESQRAPASGVLMSAFAATIAGAYSAKTISNYVSGVRAWHILNGIPWALNQQEMSALLRAADTVSPTSSRRKKRQPYTIDFITSIREKLNLEDHLDAAVFACLTTTFYSMARLGEFTVPRLTGFDPAHHVKRSDIRTAIDREGREVTAFKLPHTKSSATGEEVSWAVQEGLTDPHAALENHFRINKPLAGDHLFAYWYKTSRRPLTKPKMITRLAQAAKAANLDPLQGHGIRIGATLEYLLRGVPFDVVKVMGRWASDAFTLYLRKHAQILAPYLQARPEVQEQFIRITMPPVR
jgi:hypothetical protein